MTIQEKSKIGENTYLIKEDEEGWGFPVVAFTNGLEKS